MVELAAQGKCPDCGTPLTDERWAAGLCLSCLAELAGDVTALEAELRVEPGEAPTLQFSPDRTFSEGEIHGERYRIRSLLGRGGMGEVWRGYDLKLRQDVALKALRAELIQDKAALETLRQEVRTAREVISPNVCRVFDLQDLDGQELVSMEYIDGTTLQEIVTERSPLDLNEAREIASQFLAGLEAIHDAGLVHRDIKPENVMITRTGRVVVMDFGIAKGLADSRDGLIAGTPAYMSPEQAAGEDLDARADVFSAGVVLAEMVAPSGIRTFVNRKRIWEGIHESTPEMEDTPWSRVISRCVDGDREARYASAAELARALEEVTLRAAGDEDTDPYPGLASFTEEQSRFFFGRELEVEELWKKLRRPHLLAVIAPSGSGKSSFLRAGLLPTLPKDWGSILVTPGNRPFTALARALAEELGGEKEVVDELLRFEEPEVALDLVSRWRQQHKHALIIVDQFEELFTQNPSQVQGRFAELLGQIPLETDAFVLLSMREDFLYHCQPFKPLAPVFSELMPLGGLSGNSLRRALVQPALKCGYRFEDDTLVDEMVEEVSHERGALPLLAFAASRLWSLRDREAGLLTRDTYEQIGGVGGALAQHAEATLEEIGEQHIPIVRDLFRNLVTAQGTRAARDREELLSVFDVGEGLVPSREGTRPSPTSDTRSGVGAPLAGAHQSARVLDTLIDARLLTTYEGNAHQRIEIIHESLLTAWPRLVRWRTQDAEGAQLRDDLRQAAKRWVEKGRSEDLLWTGSAFLEYRIWRERYPGGLTAAEEEFARAMTARAERRQRRRRVAVSTVIAVLLGIVALVGALWQRSEVSRREAVLEAQRREAAQLVSLGRLRLEDYPTVALAHALASLERADTAEARRFAVETLSRGPVAHILPTVVNSVAFSRDGNWLATGAMATGVSLWSREGGSPIVVRETADTVPGIEFRPEGDVLLVRDRGTVRFVSVPDAREIRKVDLESSSWARVLARSGTNPTSRSMLGEDEARLLEGWDDRPRALHWAVSEDRRWLGYARDRTLYVLPLERLGTAPARIVGEHFASVVSVSFETDDQLLVSLDETGEIRIWSVEPEVAGPERTIQAEESTFRLDVDAKGSTLVTSKSSRATTAAAHVWDLDAPPDAEPTSLAIAGAILNSMALDRSGLWLATAHDYMGALWRLGGSHARVLRGQSPPWIQVAFTPDGLWLASSSKSGIARLWPLSPDVASRHRVLIDEDGAQFSYLAIDPTGRNLLVVSRWDARVFLVPLAGGRPRELPRGSSGWVGIPAFSPDGRKAAAVSQKEPGADFLEVWDLDNGSVRAVPFRSEHGTCGDLWFRDVRFTSDGQLLTAGIEGLQLWNLDDGSSRLLRPCREGHSSILSAISEDRFLLLETSYETEGQTLSWHDLRAGTSREILSHGNRIEGFSIALDPTGEIAVTGDADGIVRAGPVTGEEPHLLFGHRGLVSSVAVSPDGKWIASASKDGQIRLWPMPKGQPFHTLPYEELLDRLRSFTNVRVVPDESTDTGFRVEVGPFPGWERVPEW